MDSIDSQRIELAEYFKRRVLIRPDGKCGRLAPAISEGKPHKKSGKQEDFGVRWIHTS